MSAGAPSGVSWLCPSCDAEPPATVVEPTCPSCGARLIEVRSRADDLTGTVIDGRFEVRALLGEGGMGSVYRAWQRSIGREVAIKLIDQRHSRDPMAVRRFLREARLASQLSQPNTVSVFDFGQAADGRLFIAMELIRGKTLAEVLEADGPFSVARAAWVGVQLCDALDAAHRLQIVHRDLKPANVVVLDEPPGRDLIKVLDFGLAKSLTDAETQTTDTGLVVGTPRYMAPEVVMGEKPTPSSDLYAVGVILGELTTGKLLWDATSFPALAGQKLQGSPVLAEIPSAIRGVVARLIMPEQARRPATASEVRGLLRPLVMGAETPVPWTGPQRAIDAHAATPTPSPRVTAPTVALRGDDAPTLPATPTPLPEVEPPVRPAAPATPVTSATPVTPASTTSTSAVRPTSAGRRWPAAAAGLAVLGAAIAGVVVTTRSDGRGGHRAAAAAATTVNDAGAAAAEVATDAAVVPLAPEPIDAAAGPAEIVLRVTTRPSGAELTVDGVRYGATPAEVRIARGTAAVVVEVVRGGKRARKSVVPDRDRAVELILPRGGGSGSGSGGLPF